MYLPTIGLEIHAELKTRTKMFCNSANDPDETRPNVNVCPVCMAHPGTLPVINREAVRHILRIGAAVGGTLADCTEFDRKSYFYPDIPKGYQISQYDRPLVSGGELSLSTDSAGSPQASSGQASVAITRVHLEEDTARSTHAHGKSLVDFNRAGIPLMELVTEPVIRDAETAGRFARELQLLLRTLGASEANLEKGEMRIEANVSVSTEEGEKPALGTKVEVKNLNSFRSVERAIAFEIKRQIALIESGGKVVQETRGWDEARQETFHQRFKEGSADYRYFPEPDLPKLFLSEIPEFSPATIQASLPELPWERRERYQKELKIRVSDSIIITENFEGAAFFDKVIPELTSPDQAKVAVNFLISDLASEPGFVSPESFAKLVRMFSEKLLSSRGAKDVLALMKTRGGDPETVASEQGLIQVHDTTALGEIVDTVLAQEGDAVREYKGGKQSALQHLIGKAMKESKGAGNPVELQRLIIEKIG